MKRVRLQQICPCVRPSVCLSVTFRYQQLRGHGGFVGFEPPPPPTVLRGHLRDLLRTDEKILGNLPRNVVPANTLILVAHLVTLSESQWNQFHPRAKKPTASWGFPWPRQLLCPWTPLGTPLHTPRHVPLVSHLLQNSTRTNRQNDHLILHLLQISTFVTNVVMRLIFTFVPNWRCFKLSFEDSVSTFFGCFCFWSWRLWTAGRLTVDVYEQNTQLTIILPCK